NARIGLTFATALRSFLRADPDVVMVGEMRDHETASIAVEASLTGHLVLSTLHTNSAVETVVRLLDLGVDSFNFADALLGVLAQRLVKRLCPDCREPYTPAADERERLITAYGPDAGDVGLVADGSLVLYRGRGCAECRQTGYRGRLGIHELLVVAGPFKDRIYHKERMGDLLAEAKRGGLTTLLQDGVKKVLAGLTDLRAVAAVAMR
ncbi:MAG TPA: ATPase, T2SS/T4P/T4SS family, partial [Candidatus Methylomirabilis sp.]|nr:ATPase, T2SS/T4P/T4SS family [Candidatus Methylomirabilis sp.]